MNEWSEGAYPKKQLGIIVDEDRLYETVRLTESKQIGQPAGRVPCMLSSYKIQFMLTIWHPQTPMLLENLNHKQ